MIKEYTVVVTRDITESTTIYVNADSIDEAEEAALAQCDSANIIQVWIVDDVHDYESPYVTDVSGGV